MKQVVIIKGPALMGQYGGANQARKAKPNRKVEKRLQSRRADFDSTINTAKMKGFKRPGSNKK